MMLPMCMRPDGWVRNDLARGSFLSLAGELVLPMRRPVAPMLGNCGLHGGRNGDFSAAGRAVTCHAEVAACSENVLVAVRYLTV